MTRRTNARIAGFTFLFYIVAGVTGLALSKWGHAVSALSVLTSLCALVLGVTLYALTRDEDRDIALLALTCRIIEAVPGPSAAIFFAAGSTLFAGLLLRGRMIPAAMAWLGTVASAALFLLLLLQRGGLFEAAVSWSSSLTWIVWLPMLVFEVALAVWLLIKGVAEPRARRSLQS